MCVEQNVYTFFFKDLAVLVSCLIDDAGVWKRDDYAVENIFILDSVLKGEGQSAAGFTAASRHGQLENTRFIFCCI